MHTLDQRVRALTDENTVLTANVNELLNDNNLLRSHNSELEANLQAANATIHDLENRLRLSNEEN